MTHTIDPVHAPEGHPLLAYSEDEVVREMTTFYRFLTTLHVPPSALCLAPYSGWRSVTARRLHLAVGRKDPAVLSLAQRLPYVSRPAWDEGHEVFPITCGVDYAKSYLGGLMRRAEAEAVCGRRETDEQIMAGGQTLDDLGVNPDRSELVVPEHMLVLASAASAKNGAFWMLNTRNGTVTILHGGMRGGEADGLCSVDVSYILLFYVSLVEADQTMCKLPEDRDDPTTAWRKEETYVLAGFLSLMKRLLRALYYVCMLEPPTC